MTYYWVVPMTTTKDGRPKPYIIGDKFFNSKQAAENYAGELAMDSEVCPVSTTNKKKARKELRFYLAKKYAKEQGDFTLGTSNAQWKDREEAKV